MKKIGYARISTDDQNLDLQLDALKKAGCEQIFQEIESGAKRDRAILTQCLASLSSGDCLVVWKLDRLGRSVKHLLDIMENLKDKNIQFQSLSESIDTTSPMGQLIFHLFAALAEFERELIRERSKAGMRAAMDRGVHCGRPKIAKIKIQAVKQLVEAGDPVSIACEKVGISRATYYQWKPKVDK